MSIVDTANTIGRKRLIYIAGEAHCGSTAADFLLGRYVGRSCGQLVELGESVNADGTLNGNGVAAVTSSYWCEFLRHAPPRDRADYRWLFEELLHERKFIRYCLSRSRRSEYARRFDNSIRPVFAHLGCDTIVDSSKNATRALGLAESGFCDVYVVHLVRNPAHFLVSIAKRRNGLGVSQQMKWAAHWVAKNLFALLLRHYHGKRYIRVEYGALFSDPYNTLAPLFSQLGVRLTPPEFSAIYADERQEPQTVGGNRIRISGPLRFQYKDVGSDQLQVLRQPARALCGLLARLFVRGAKPRRQAAPSQDGSVRESIAA